MKNNILIAIEILENVLEGKDTMDSQSATIIWEYILELRDKLHRRNLQIKESKKKIKNLIWERDYSRKRIIEVHDLYLGTNQAETVKQ